MWELVCHKLQVDNVDGCFGQASACGVANLVFDSIFFFNSTHPWSAFFNRFDGGQIQEFSSKKAVILGISRDSEAKNKAFRDKFDFPFDLLCDSDGAMSLLYGAIASADQKNPSRISYLVDPQGVVRKAYAKVRPADHPGEVLQDLE